MKRASQSKKKQLEDDQADDNGLLRALQRREEGS
jgi:hypothetical protein